MDMGTFEIGFVALIGVLFFIAIWVIFYFIPVGLWFSALVSGVRILDALAPRSAFSYCLIDD